MKAEASSTTQLKLNLYGPPHTKPCLWGFHQSEIQTTLLSYRYLLDLNFARSRPQYTFQKANKGTDQTAL